MKPNLCLIDRIIRVVVGVALACGGLLLVRGVLGIVMALVGAVLVFSGSVGFCRVYEFFGDMSTRRK